MGKAHRTFTREFKIQTVELIQSGNRPVAQIARELGIVETVLRRWVQQFSQQGETAFPGKGHQTGLEEEVKRLRREVEVLKMEREVLKKALLICSTDTRR